MNLHIANATIHLHHGATSALQDFAASAVFAEAPMTVRIAPPAHGEPWPGQGGRYICTLPPLLGMPERHLIAGDGEAEDLTYGPAVDVPGAASHINGRANTAALLATGLPLAAIGRELPDVRSRTSTKQVARDRMRDDVRDLALSHWGPPALLIDAAGDPSTLTGGRPIDVGDALIIATSGTSGRPKGIVHTHRSLEYMAFATSTALGVEGDTRWLVALP